MSPWIRLLQYVANVKRRGQSNAWLKLLGGSIDAVACALFRFGPAAVCFRLTHA
jgi:hypothetical protein